MNSLKMKANIPDVETTVDSSNKTGSSKKLIQPSLFAFAKKIDTPISKNDPGDDTDITVLDVKTPQGKNENSIQKTPRRLSNSGEIQPKKIKLEKSQNVVSDEEVSSSDQPLEKNELPSNLVNPLDKFIRRKTKNTDEVTTSNSEDFLLVAEELSQTLEIPIGSLENSNFALTIDSLKPSSISEMVKKKSNDFDDKTEPECQTPKRERSSEEKLDIQNMDITEVCTFSNDLDTTLKSSKKVTPKQLQREAEIIKRREEKEQKKLEKELQKANEKAEKEKMKKEKQEEKEKQKQAEIEAKEKKREQERQKKEEERMKKEEERLKKEEERLKKEEEKIQQEEQERLKQEKAKQAFESFFTKRKSDSVTPFKDNEEIEASERFKPFCVKDNMQLAPLTRTDFSETRRRSMDTLLNGTVPVHHLYLEELKNGAAGKGKSTKISWRVENKEDDIEIIEEEGSDAESLVDNSEDVIVVRDPLQNTKMHWKLLQFCENRRPAFWGTWTKSSSVVGPRRPLGKDEHYFDYEVDSDDEWEEEEPGESISDSEGEEQEPADDYEVDNEFFVPHGYLSDEEAEDEMEDLSPEARKEKLKLKEEDFAKELKKKTKVLKPSLVGCIWEDEIISNSSNSHLNKIFGAYRSVLCFPQPIHTSLGGAIPPFLDKPSPADAADESLHEGKDKSGDIPPEDMIHLIQEAHGFRFKKAILIEKFLEYWDSKYQGMEHVPKRPSKVKLVRIFKEIANYGKCLETNFSVWVVNPATVKEYNIEGLPNFTLASSVASTSSKPEVTEEPAVTPARKSLITMYTQSMTPDEVRKQQEKAQRKRASLVTLPRSSTSVSFGEKESHIIAEEVNGAKSSSPKNEVREPPVKKKVAFVTLSSPQKSKGSSSVIPRLNSKNPKEEKKDTEIVYLD